MGENSYINCCCYFDFTGHITLESNVKIGHGVTFVTADHEIGGHEHRCGAITPKDIVIKRGAWVGANSTILPGVTIEEGAVIAAGSVVTKDIAADTLVGGVPARHIRAL